MAKSECYYARCACGLEIREEGIVRAWLAIHRHHLQWATSDRAGELRAERYHRLSVLKRE